MTDLHVSKLTSGKQAPLLVLLHGWGTSSKIWHPCIEKLSKHFEIWCIDLPGHGESQSIEWNASVDQGMKLLVDVMPPVCSVVGWSLGGLWAQLYMQYFPERIKKLLLIASTPKFIASESWQNGMPEAKFKLFRENFKKTPQKTLQQFITLQALNGKYAKKVVNVLSQSIVGEEYKKIAWGLNWLEEIDLRDMEIKNENSVYLFQGENDQVSSVAAAEDTAKIWSSINLFKIAQAGHVPFISHPELFIEYTLDMSLCHS